MILRLKAEFYKYKRIKSERLDFHNDKTFFKSDLIFFTTLPIKILGTLKIGTFMANHYPTPSEIGLRTPFYLRADIFDQGFLCALKGKEVNLQQEKSRSFQAGYRLGLSIQDEIR